MDDSGYSRFFWKTIWRGGEEDHESGKGVLGFRRHLSRGVGGQGLMRTYLMFFWGFVKRKKIKKLIFI